MDSICSNISLNWVEYQKSYKCTEVRILVNVIKKIDLVYKSLLFCKGNHIGK